jgi:hypothetical protein|nr:MAG TPA: hypothetical protein [Caudoviricetes sp.]DAW32856.1 MAG TPA: hypothetical protein [Caudoviricetes sp.]
MIVEFEKELISALKEVCKNTSIYLGEFEDKNEMELLIKGSDEFVFVEFVDEKYEDMVRKNVNFNIHILCTTSSKQQIYRQENRYKAINLAERIDKKLNKSFLDNEFSIRLNNLKVLHNSITDYGYMYVLSRQISTDFLQKDSWLES